ncbi:hypothetical protein GOBAR_AA06155 [Gossypium barbadense]|uniref:Uncharacterized protein n=1 Tax=Gossypium barbadense TaxID=3634 RepID=A0A2P5YFS0_GOSBA|nr:hypothetical protein GOBAR_AA06155 [Gossypium barbadense]
MLGKVSNTFEGGRISINWLEINFDKLPNDAMEEVVQQYARAFIIRLIGGILVPDKSRNLVPSYVGLPNELEDVRLLLDQRSENEFEWMSYTDLEIISCIPSKVLANQEICDTKVSLIVYATARTMQQSTTEEDDDAVIPKEMISQGTMLGTYLSDDDDEKKVYRPPPPDAPPIEHQVVRLVKHRNPPHDRCSPPCGNPPHDRCSPLCGTHSP